ncbi:hypothetical protein EK21DRAFT_17341, partial [Setomelanomma holmii]
ISPIEDVITAIKSCESGDDFTYTEVPNQFGVERSMLSRRHKGKTSSFEAKAISQKKPSLEQELELVRYIGDLSKRGLPPTREMIQNFASAMAKEDVSESWVTHNVNNYEDQLTAKWTTGMDRVRHQADSEDKYKLYLDLLHSEIDEYQVEPQHMYNMDEKGFLIGVTSRSKRIFSKHLWQQGQVPASLQDGSREWVTVLASICADRSALPPALIYQGKTLQSSWVEDVKVGKHNV